MALLWAALAIPVGAYDNGVASSPPMGWNTWCTDDLCGLIDHCTETEVKSVADALVSSGLKDLGYTYVNLDDCWAAKERDDQGRLQGEPKQFPSGMAALADYVHGLGLKLGLYTCVGTETCKYGRPGSYGHFDIDAQTFADWGVDQVKADYCHRGGNETSVELYTTFSEALNATGRPMLFSLCEWGEDEVWTGWGASVGQMMRVQMDHLPLWHYPPQAAGVGFGQGVRDIIEWMGHIGPSKWTKQHGWLDPDFLMTMFLEKWHGDWEPMTFTDSRTEFSFWALWASPLVFATDPRNMTDEKKAILMNEEVIAVNQDALFAGGDRLYNATDGTQAWSKPLANGDVAVILYNRGTDAEGAVTTGAKDVSVTWQQLGWADDGTASTYTMRDLWAHDAVQPSDPATGHTASVLPKDVQMFRIARSSTKADKDANTE